MTRSGKKILRFTNLSGKLDNVIKFLENIQKKVNYINMNISVEGCKIIKITLHGSRDLQYLACDRLRELAQRYL